jgi:hypothetical protein
MIFVLSNLRSRLWRIERVAINIERRINHRSDHLQEVAVGAFLLSRPETVRCEIISLDQREFGSIDTCQQVVAATVWERDLSCELRRQEGLWMSAKVFLRHLEWMESENGR